MSPDIKAECDSWTSKQLASQKLAPDSGLAELYRGHVDGTWKNVEKRGGVDMIFPIKNGDLTITNGELNQNGDFSIKMVSQASNIVIQP